MISRGRLWRGHRYNIRRCVSVVNTGSRCELLLILEKGQARVHASQLVLEGANQTHHFINPRVFHICWENGLNR